MPHFGRPVSGVILSALCALSIRVAADAAPAAGRPADTPVDQLTLLVPAAAGGGWDLTARAMQSTLEGEGLARRVRILHLPRVGGLIGINPFIEAYRGHGDMLVVGGLAMMGAGIHDSDTVNLDELIPMARLTGDWEVIAVRRDSPIVSVAKLRDRMVHQPGQLRWAGRALGGIDHGLVWSLARHVGAPVAAIQYDADEGDNAVARSITERRSDIGVSGYAEFEPGVASGALRILAVAAPRPILGVAAPTLPANGIDVTSMNWRGVFAPPGLNVAQRSRMDHLIQAMVASPAWRTRLRQQRWTDAWLAGPEFSRFLDNERNRWTRVIGQTSRSESVWAILARDRNAAGRRLRVIIGLAAGLALCLGWAGMVLWRRNRDAALLRDRCSLLASQLDESSGETNQRIQDGVKEDFSDWQLSLAERDIAWLMLRGLPFQQIAELRGTSERTVRQQAQAIYRKAGLDSRSDLAGRVLERFI